VLHPQLCAGTCTAHPVHLRTSTTAPTRARHAAGGRVTWAEKMEMAMHTGNVGSPYRKKVAAVAEKHPAEMLVNELFIGAPLSPPP
jgi:hypothetical protein